MTETHRRGQGGTKMGDKVVLVTGGGSGIGRAICERFAEDGAQLVAVARSMKGLEDTRALAASAGGRCHVESVDLCEADEIYAMVENTVARFKRLDVLVNCAGVAPLENIEDLDPSVFQMLMSVNVNAVYHACRSVWPIMKQQGEGVIVNISSVSSVDPFPGFTAYGASKAWINAWTRGLGAEGRSCGIRVFAVAPGAVETPLLRDVFPEFPADRALQPRDVADTVHALSQEDCRYVTGETVFIRR